MELIKELEKINGKKIVYIIGAGTSKADGIPLLKDIKKALRRLINDCVSYPRLKREKLEEAYSYWEDKFPDKNIEEVMTFLENENEQDLLKSFEYSYVAIFIYYAYHYDYYRESRKERNYSAIYTKFINRVLSEKADIISLNVDNQICDCVYWDVEINKQIRSCSQMQEKLKSVEVFDNNSKEELIKEIVSALTDSWPFKFKRIHGSISYPNFRKESGNEIVIKPSFEDLEKGKHRIEYPGYKRYKDFPELPEALRLIREAEKIIIIGYSFPKSDIVWGLGFSKAIAENMNKPDLEIVNPAVKSNENIINNYLEAIPSKYKNKVRFYPITFEEFLGQD